jgi:hypothetical protein
MLEVFILPRDLKNPMQWRSDHARQVHFMVKKQAAPLQLIAFFGNNHSGWTNQFAF